MCVNNTNQRQRENARMYTTSETALKINYFLEIGHESLDHFTAKYLVSDVQNKNTYSVFYPYRFGGTPPPQKKSSESPQ